MNKLIKTRKVRFESQDKLVTFSEVKPILSPSLALQENATSPMPVPGTRVVEHQGLLFPALCQLMTDPNMARYNDYFILYHLKGLIATYEPLIQTDVAVSQEVLEDYKPTRQKVSEAMRTKIAQSLLTSVTPSDPTNQLKLGLVVYIGSPLSGEMVIVNDQLVDEWITYTRKAIEKKAVTTFNEMLPLNSLAQLINLKVIPEGRHMIKINYGCENNCFTSPHDLVTWTSERSPCVITSCRYYN